MDKISSSMDDRHFLVWADSLAGYLGRHLVLLGCQRSKSYQDTSRIQELSSFSPSTISYGPLQLNAAGDSGQGSPESNAARRPLSPNFAPSGTETMFTDAMPYLLANE